MRPTPGAEPVATVRWVTNRVVEGDAAADVVLRVRHVVDGELVETAPGRVAVLARVESDTGRVGVPLASAEEASAMLELCAGGLARWLALGDERRKAALFAMLELLKDRVFEWATAWSDDLGILASGAVVVLLPAPEAPRAMFELLTTALDAGLPAGAMNVIYAEEPVRYGLIAHPLVASVDGVETHASDYLALGDAFEKPVLGLGETR